MSWQARALSTGMRWVAKPYLQRVKAAPQARGSLDRVARWSFRMPPGAVLTGDVLSVENRDDVPAMWAHGARVSAPGIILFFHGGGYVAGSARTHAGMIARLAKSCGMRAVLPNYRLAPDAPFPDAVDDAMTAWLALVARGFDPAEIALGGDSAGGGLAAALLGQLVARGMALPGRVFLMSPWSDLSLSGETLNTKARLDPLLPVNRIRELCGMYLQGSPGDDPRASPLFARFDGCRRVLIQAGTDEILLSDSTRLAEKMRRDGVDVDLQVWTGMPHVWQLFQGLLPEADQALTRIASFLAGGARTNAG